MPLLSLHKVVYRRCGQVIYHPKVKFRDRSNYDERLVVSTFNPDSGETDTYLTMEPVYQDSYDGTLRTDYGAKYNDVARPSVTFIDIDGEDIQPSKVRSVLRWLTGSRQNAWMDVYNMDGELMCSYLGRFTDVKLQKMDARVIGIRAEFTSVSPWAYSAEQTVIMRIEGATDFSIDNESDDLYSYVYPRMTFSNDTNGANFSLQNDATSEKTDFYQLQQGEVITINNNFVAYSSNAARIFNNDFNFVFPALVAGMNKFHATGKGTLSMSFRYPMKVSDGLLNNYEVKNDVIIYVENNIVKIRGNTDLVPPVGVNIKIVGETLIARGDIKNVKTKFDEDVFSVNNDILTIDDGMNECPFDEFNAEVQNGRLIITKKFSNVQIEG